jgi:NADH-quinone oxidoreductase subunit M
MITTALLFFPLVIGIALFFIKGGKVKHIAFGASLVELILGLIAFCQFDKKQVLAQYTFNTPWIKSMGIDFHIGMDGISLVLVLLTVVLLPFILLVANRNTYKNTSTLYALMLLMQFGLVGVFTAQDAFLFYIFWEVALIPIYFIALLWGGAERIRITFKFFIYTLAGSLLMLVALIYLYLQTPLPHSFSIQALYNLELSAGTQSWVFWMLFLAFAIKMPVFPFHSWLADTYTDAPTPGTMLLSGIMSKMGVYGAIRLLLPIVPAGILEWGPTAITLAIIGVVYASLMAMFQKDYKRLIAYSSAAHVGLIAAGVFTITETGLSGAVINMFAHGISAFGLFYVVDILVNRTKTRQIDHLGGIRVIAPVYATVFMIIMMASIALPLTSGFIGEFLLLAGIYEYNGWLAVFGGLTTILGAVYMLKSYQTAILGDTNPKIAHEFFDLVWKEKVILFPIILLIFVLGVYPTPLLEVIEPAVQNIFTLMGVTFK